MLSLAVPCRAVLCCAVLRFILKWTVDACSCTVDSLCRHELKVLGSVQRDFMCACEPRTYAPCQHYMQDCVSAAFRIKSEFVIRVVLKNIIGVIMMLSL